MGLHDFSNFCKKDESIKGQDVDEDLMFLRRIYSYKIVKVQDCPEDPTLNVHMAIIKGSAFLWHQVRCMMSVLFLIGKGQEEENVITKLYDTEKIKERPNYDIADGKNLILSDCGFEGIKWKNCNFYSDLETYNLVK